MYHFPSLWAVGRPGTTKGGSMAKHLRFRPFALFSAFAVTSATVAAVLAAPATAGTGPIRFVGHPRTVSSSAVPASTNLSERAELTILRDRMEEDAEFSPAGKSIAITKNLPLPEDLTDAVPSGLGFQGLTHFDSRYSEGGSQFSGEPADLGMCTDGTYVLELVNNAVQLFGTDGTPVYVGSYGNAGRTFTLGGATGRNALSLNEFFGQPMAYDRANYNRLLAVQTTEVFGPNLFDVSCTYDKSSGYWFATSAKIDVNPYTGDYTARGANSVLIMTTGTPADLDSWSIWEIDTTNDGENGTPIHTGCGGACFGDYPQLGVNEDGVFITTNEFSFFGSGFTGAQLYAIDKQDLMSAEASPDFAHLENIEVASRGDVAYTLQPANTVDTTTDSVMYFGMSQSPYSATVTDRFTVYALDTSELASDASNVTMEDLVETTVTTNLKYGAPQWALQKKGDTPYLTLLNAGYFGYRYAQIKPPIPLDAGSGKFYGAWRDDDFLYFSTATAAKGTGGATYSSKNGSWASIKQRAALALFVVAIPDSTEEHVDDDGIYGVAGQNLIYPSVAVSNGNGAMGATLVGPNYFPAVAYVPFSFDGASLTVTQIVMGVGIGPNDGFTGTGDGGYRTRWGDYGAAAVDGDGDLWFAAHDIAGSCTVTEYRDTSSNVQEGICGGERTTLANWSTRIFQVDL